MLMIIAMLKTTGYILFIFSCLSFLMILVVPWFGFSKIQTAGLITGLLIAGETSFWLSLIILGRSFWDQIKSNFKFWKKKTGDSNLPKQSDQNNIIN